VSEQVPESFSVLLGRWRSGDKVALERLLPLVYNDLRALAHKQLRRERPGHTLQTTALVHEAYLKIAGRPVEAEDRAHFVAIAARLMRQILVDYARGHGAAKRGADRRVALSDMVVDGLGGDAAGLPAAIRNPHLLSLDDALTDLSRIDEQQSRIVELRFFGGLTVEEAADVLGISRSTAKRDWKVAKAWLCRHIKRGSDGQGPPVGKD
jgi:RNA polymerase sigma factor (TIGR02999 family)